VDEMGEMASFNVNSDTLPSLLLLLLLLLVVVEDSLTKDLDLGRYTDPPNRDAVAVVVPVSSFDFILDHFVDRGGSKDTSYLSLSLSLRFDVNYT
jgi:hypothetical protein